MQAPSWLATVAASPANDSLAGQSLPLAGSRPACCARLRDLGFRSNLPVVVLETGGKVVPIREQVDVKVCVCGDESGG